MEGISAGHLLISANHGGAAKKVWRKMLLIQKGLRQMLLIKTVWRKMLLIQKGWRHGWVPG